MEIKCSLFGLSQLQGAEEDIVKKKCQLEHHKRKRKKGEEERKKFEIILDTQMKK